MESTMEANTEQQIEAGSTSQVLAVSTKRAAEMLGTSPKTIYRLLQRGKIKGVRILRTHLIPVAELKRLVGGKN